MRILASVVLATAVFGNGFLCAEETAPPPAQAPAVTARALPVKPPKESFDGRKIFDKSVNSAKIDSGSASSGMVLTGDGNGGALWGTSSNTGTFTGIFLGSLTGTVSGNVTGNVTGSSSSFTGILQGDVNGTQSLTTVSSVGGLSATSIANGVNAANAATTASTPNSIVKRDSNGNIPGAVVGGVTLSGDVTGPSSSSVVSTLGGMTAANVVSGANTANAATNLNTVSTIVKRDASGNFNAGTINANLIGNTTGAHTGNVTGNVSGSAATFTGNLGGDVTGSQAATVISAIGGSSAANVHLAELLASERHGYCPCCKWRNRVRDAKFC